MLEKDYVPRNQMFMAKGVLRLDASGKEAMESLGRMIGNAVCRSFKESAPVKEICLYGGYGSGKSSLANAILSGFDNSGDLGLQRTTRIESIADTYPKCRHIDYALYAVNPAARSLLPEYKIPDLAEDEMLIGEWCIALPDAYIQKDRLDIEMVNSGSIEGALNKDSYFFPSPMRVKNAPPAIVNSKVRIMTVIGQGNGADMLAKLMDDADFKMHVLSL